MQYIGLEYMELYFQYQVKYLPQINIWEGNILKTMNVFGSFKYSTLEYTCPSYNQFIFKQSFVLGIGITVYFGICP
jgi:hypothetical protein